MIAEGEINWGKDGPRGASPERLKEMTKDIHDWVRQVRGGFLSGAFAIERSLSAAIIHYFLGPRVALDEVQSAFDDGILQALSFDRRISAARLVAERVFTDASAKRLVDGLGKIRGVRNVMAHQPFGLVPQFNPDGSLYCLTPVLKQGKGTLVLTTALIEEQNTAMKEMIALSERLIVAVLVAGGLKLPEAASTADFRSPPETDAH